jgi:hypothetical protein
MSNEQLNQSPNPSEMLKSAQVEQKVISTKPQSQPIVMRPRFGDLVKDILCASNADTSKL